MSVEDRPKTAAGSESLLTGGGAAPPGKDPLVGKRFGNCLIQRKIGSGSMGHVYLAHHVGLNKAVAIKIMSAELIGTAANVQRFLLEARIAASLEHPHVVQVFDVGEANGLYYLAMQYVEGRSLDRMLESKGKLDLPEATGIIRKVALALAAAHQLGIVHRDIKPANVLLSKDGQVKVADFGLARFDDSSQSAPGQIVGTPYYMSPEQAQGSSVDPRSDLYSLGATYYHLVTGQRPFEGDTPISVILKHVNEPPPPPDQIEPSVPPAVSQMILKLLAKRADDRYSSAEEVVGALAAFESASSASTVVEKIPDAGGESMADLFPAPNSEPAPAPAPPPAAKRETVRRPPPSEEAPSDVKTERNPVIGKYLLVREIQKEDDDLSVWEAENVLTKAPVALWLLTGQDADRVRAFQRVAADLTPLKHPNILQILECYSETDRKGNVAYYTAVELVNGLPLEDLVSGRMLPRDRLIQLCEQLARALGFAHQRRRTHLTLSPRDVQVEPPSRPIISFLPFGPSRKDEAKTRARALQAAPFLAPEQVPGAEATPDAATDVYRLGALLYWIVTGRAPFEASSLADYYTKILKDPPKALKAIDPKIDPELDRVITTAMRKEKDLRFASAEEMADALRKLLKPKDAAAPATSPRPAAKKPEREGLKVLIEAHGKRVIAYGVLLLLLIAGGMMWSSRRNADGLAEEMGRARLEAFTRQLDGKFEEALAAARRGLALFPSDEGMLKLSKTCQRKILEAAVLGQVEKVQAAVRAGEVSAFVEEAAALDGTVRDLRAALGPAPTAGDASSVTAAGIGEFHLGKAEEAVELLEKAAALESKDPDGGLALARAYFARMVLSNAVARVMGAKGTREAGAVEWRTRMLEAMERPTRPAREGADADLADAYAALGRGEMERVKTLTETLLRRGPGPATSSEARTLRAWATGGVELFDLDEAIKAQPVQTLAYVIRAVRLAERGHRAEAAADLGSPADLFPNLPVFPLLRSKIRHSMGDLEGARADLARIRIPEGETWEFQGELERLARTLPAAPPK